MKGWIVSTGSSLHRGRIYSTYSGGNNWSVDNVDTQFPLDLNDIYFINDNIGWAVGVGGTVFRTDSGSINYIGDKWMNNKIRVFTLEQDYPNPFNPSTVIKYEIPVSGNVEIKVFNILGKEVAVLVNEYKNKGVYKLSLMDITFPVESISII